jgi:hypothetical protein
MKRFLLAICILISSPVFTGTMDSCEKISGTSLGKCVQEIIASSNWEPLKSNLAAALVKSQNNINIKFDPSLDRSAITKVEVQNNRYVPVVVLGKSTDRHELLITFNHELVHYISTFDRLAHVYDGVKINKCLTKYQLLTLQDEAYAFKAELDFWNNSPLTFKEHFKNSFFNSKVFQKKVNYDEFYKLLDKNLSQDKNFILKKYIDMREYSQCAKEII